ncbi:MAG TPA: SUMF1/EgtB/PvdO family nonheme iron enzyme [Bradyrhizobium sp.]|nr:SUMF1/EgtB/PvdO family nonheme iron enzyme [Bradyrhizobium sp.]
MVDPVSRTIAVKVPRLRALAAILFTIGCVLPIWALYQRTQTLSSDSKIPSGALRPAMVELPPLSDGTSFAIAESEVTQLQFHRVSRRTLQNAAHAGVDSWDGCPVRLHAAGSDMPITCITPGEAARYANALTEIENGSSGRQLTSCYNEAGQWIDEKCSGYRLPTMDEWKHAASEGAAESYAVGDKVDCTRAHLPPCHGVNKTPLQVKSLQPSAWQLFDMYGNVSEIVMVNKGAAWAALGGSWADAADKGTVLPESRTNVVGLRIVRVQAAEIAR